VTSTYSQWMAEGHEYFLSCLKNISDRELDEPSRLPGWTGRHLLSHVGHNARALARLAHWAATGEQTPMYATTSARAEEIDIGARWPAGQLRDFVVAEQDLLTDALSRISGGRWRIPVRTAQGRTVPASAIGWLRSREVWIHARDLPSGGDFTDFPEAFLDALIDDALARRATQSLDLDVQATDRPARPGGGSEQQVLGTAADLARWLTRGERSPALRTAAGAPAPQLPPWL
jgi:maleylpyruvate isomerase